MMKKLDYRDDLFEEEIARLLTRTPFDRSLDRQVETILDDVRRNGDAAVIRYARQFDHVEMNRARFKLDDDEISQCIAGLNEPTRAAIREAHENIREFSIQRIPRSWHFTPRSGVILGEQFRPLSRVLAYIPGGKSPLSSTVIHTVTLAKAAGVREILVTSPPTADGSLNPAIVYASKLAGATEIYRLGGVYAIAVFAFGTESVRRVDKIVGPGNAYVTAAKRLVYGDVAIDLVAGPSEVVILADETAVPAHVAADMLAQAEHGSGSEIAVLLCTSESVTADVGAELDRQAKQLKRGKFIGKVLENGAYLIHIESLSAGIEIINRFAPEHLELMTAEPERLLGQIETAGAVFLGPWTAEAIGDYVAGPSHVLPTGGAGRSFSGLTVDQFFRRISTIQYNETALTREASVIQDFARMEGLDAHEQAIRIRIAGA